MARRHEQGGGVAAPSVLCERRNKNKNKRGHKGYSLYAKSKTRMNYYYKTPVYDDMVSYRETETAGTDYPLREYFNATPLGVTYDQFSEFITLI